MAALFHMGKSQGKHKLEMDEVKHLYHAPARV
jgi:hypothetical protein